MYRRYLKRIIDLILALSAAILLSPLLLILTVVGAIAMKGNPFFVQARPGKKDETGQERVFNLVKFRTMSNKKDKDGNLLPDEMRLNGYGKFLRSTSLDELGELWNIIKGDMSLVGPRPLLVKDMVFMSEQQRKRHDVRPGLTGLAQISGRNNITWERKLMYDIEYINKFSLFYDVKILFCTVGKVLRREDTVREGTMSDLDFGDWLLKNRRISVHEYEEKILEAKSISETCFDCRKTD